MVIVAGPPGSGKTTRFPVADFEVDSFNADNRAAQLNDGSFRSISREIRSQVNVEFQKWILDRISARKSFALETTLRSQVTFEQTHLAREHGFDVLRHAWQRRRMHQMHRGPLLPRRGRAARLSKSCWS